MITWYALPAVPCAVPRMARRAEVRQPAGPTDPGFAGAAGEAGSAGTTVDTGDADDVGAAGDGEVAGERVGPDGAGGDAPLVSEVVTVTVPAGCAGSGGPADPQAARDAPAMTVTATTAASGVACGSRHASSLTRASETRLLRMSRVAVPIRLAVARPPPNP